MLEEISPRLAVLAQAKTGDELAATLKGMASPYGFGSVVLIDFAHSGNAIDRIVDTERWRGRWLLDYLSGPSGQEAQKVIGATAPSAALVRADFPEGSPMLANLQSVEILDALVVPVFANGRLASLAAYCGAVEMPGSPGRDTLEVLALAALAYFHALPLVNTDSSRVYLTDREQQVLRLAAAGLTSREIAENLGMSQRTTNQHIDNAGNKLATRNRAHTVAEAIRLGLLT